MPPAPTDPLFQALLSPFALLILVWVAVGAALIRWPDAPRGVRRMMGLGLGLAMVTGLGSLALARPFLTEGTMVLSSTEATMVLSGTEGTLILSSLWLFGAGLALAMAGVVRLMVRSGGGRTR